MPVGKNSLARAAKQVSEQKNPASTPKTTQTKKTPIPKKPKTDVEALPIEALVEKVPADEVSRPAISAVPDVPFTPNPLPAIDVEDELATETASVEVEDKSKYALGDDLPYYLL